jgi:hypothetical protein
LYDYYRGKTFLYLNQISFHPFILYFLSNSHPSYTDCRYSRKEHQQDDCLCGTLILCGRKKRKSRNKCKREFQMQTSATE